MTLQEKVDSWLVTIGSTSVKQADPVADWHYQIEYPVKSGHVMHVVSPKDKRDVLVILSVLVLSNEFQEAFGKLDPDAKDAFLWELRRAQNTFETDFEWKDAPGRLDCPTQIATSVTRYEDGLTLDSFARSLGAVYKRELSALWVIIEQLAPREHGGGGGRFDFRKLGV